MAATSVVLYGDFNCPWSLLASRRATLLQREGVQVDWRAVEHAPSRIGRDRAAARFAALRDEAERVLDWLLPGERLPYTLAGFATDTRAAINAYAEAYRAGAASLARTTLFEAFWNHAVDLADPHVVHTLLVDAIRTAPRRGTGVSPVGLRARRRPRTSRPPPARPPVGRRVAGLRRRHRADARAGRRAPNPGHSGRRVARPRARRPGRGPRPGGHARRRLDRLEPHLLAPRRASFPRLPRRLERTPGTSPHYAGGVRSRRRTPAPGGLRAAARG